MGLRSCQAAKCQRVYRRSGESPVCSSEFGAMSLLGPSGVCDSLGTGTSGGFEAQWRASSSSPLKTQK